MFVRCSRSAFYFLGGCSSTLLLGVALFASLRLMPFLAFVPPGDCCAWTTGYSEFLENVQDGDTIQNTKACTVSPDILPESVLM